MPKHPFYHVGSGMPNPPPFHSQSSTYKFSSAFDRRGPTSRDRFSLRYSQGHVDSPHRQLQITTASDGRSQRRHHYQNEAELDFNDKHSFHSLNSHPRPSTESARMTRICRAKYQLKFASNNSEAYLSVLVSSPAPLVEPRPTKASKRL